MSVLTSTFQADKTGTWEGHESGIKRENLRNYCDFLHFACLIQKLIFTRKESTCFKYVCISFFIYVCGRLPGLNLSVSQICLDLWWGQIMGLQKETWGTSRKATPPVFSAKLRCIRASRGSRCGSHRSPFIVGLRTFQGQYLSK